jgi:TPR repeat protein
MKSLISCFAVMLTPLCGPATAHDKGDDPVENVKMLRPLAEKGNPLAQYNLGVLYSIGSGVKQDHGEAAKWFRLSSAKGTALAQYRLAGLYAEGKGVKQDFVRAHMWSSLAATQGNVDAKTQRERLAKHMKAAQLAEAEKLAIECTKQHYAGCD